MHEQPLWYNRRMAYITFDAIEPPSEPIETLIADLNSPDPATRLAAVDRVSQWYYQNTEIIEQVRPLILRLLADPDRSVQISAILAAGDALKDEAGTALIKTYEHSAHDRGVQLVAVKSMGRANTWPGERSRARSATSLGSDAFITRRRTA